MLGCQFQVGKVEGIPSCTPPAIKTQDFDYQTSKTLSFLLPPQWGSLSISILVVFSFESSLHSIC